MCLPSPTPGLPGAVCVCIRLRFGGAQVWNIFSEVAKGKKCLFYPEGQ